MLGAAAGETPQDLIGLGGAEPEGGGVLDDLVVLLLDQLPADGTGEHGFKLRSEVASAGVGRIEAYGADVL